MKLQRIRIGEKKVSPLGIPSGCVATSVRCLERIINLENGPGFVVTKSYGPRPRIVPERDEVENPDASREYGYREPIFQQYALGCFVNAVGLTNPGGEVAAQELSQISIPKNKAVIGSVYGRDIDEFVMVARKLEPFVDAIEGNVSCPHVKGHGVQLGQDPEFCHELAQTMKREISIPFYEKLPPIPNIAESAKAAVAGGVDGLSMINTERGYSFVLSNGNCGLSGRGIKPLGIRCVRDVRQAVGEKVLIIGGGGIETAGDARDYFNAGANAVTIGRGLVGMTEHDIEYYFMGLKSDLETGNDFWARDFLRKVDMDYRKVKVKEVVNSGCDFKVFITDSRMYAYAGQFVFARIQGVGEKPFSVMDDDPLTLGVLERGYFTRHFNSLKKGDEFQVRGPYGKDIDVPQKSNIVLAGGGCGIAGLFLLAKQINNPNTICLLAAKDKEHLPHLDRFQEHAKVYVATEDGSLGTKGLVTDLFREASILGGSYFFNCGPRAMVEAVLPLELQVSGGEKIYSSVEYMTRCGVGICGSCADKDGRRTCVEGPFMNLS